MIHFLPTGSVSLSSGGALTGVSEQQVETIHTSITNNPTKSIKQASVEVRVPKSTVHRV